MRATKKFTDELFAKVSPHVVLGDLVGAAVRPAGETKVHCVNQNAHKNGDASPSASANGETGLYRCFACDLKGDVVTLAQHVHGLPSVGDAIRWLDERYHVTSNGNGASSRAPASPRATEAVDAPRHEGAPRAVVTGPSPEWPYYPATARALGWELLAAHTDARGRVWPAALRVQTFDADFKPFRTKFRGPRDDAGNIRADFARDGKKGSGLINSPAIVAIEDSSPLVLLVNGETSLLAAERAARAGGVECAVVCHSAGEGTPLGEYVRCFAECRVVVVGDADDAGRAQAPLRAEELRAGGAASVRLVFPPEGKDARGYLELGHSLAELVALPDALAAPMPESQPTRICDSWDFADTVDGPEEPPPDEFVERLFVRPSLNVVFGPPQAGKSWAIMALCLDAVLGGGSFLGCEDLRIRPLIELRDGRPERVLWIFGTEDTPARIRRRLKTVRDSGPHAGKLIPRGAFVYATPPGGMSIHSAEGWAWLGTKIRETGATIVVLDTISSLTAASLDLSKNGEVAPFVTRLNLLRAEIGLVLFALCHTRKGSADPRKNTGTHADSLLGAGTWRALSEGVLMLDSKDGDTSDVTVRSIKAKDIDNPIPTFHTTLERPGARFRPLDEGEAPPEMEPVQKARGRPAKLSADSILALRPKFPDGIRWCPEDAGAAVDVKRATWFERQKDVASDLVSRGCVFIDGTLRWPTPATEGHSS